MSKIIGSDHAGVDLKEQIKKFLSEKGDHIVENSFAPDFGGFIVKTFLARIFYVHCRAGSHEVNLPEKEGWRGVGQR
jgi:hypothetical protein